MQSFGRWANLESIIELAAQELDTEEKAPDKQVADEWLTRFSKMARDVDAEEMQICCVVEANIGDIMEFLPDKK